MKLHITHETCYDYAPAVDIAQHMAYLQPRNTRNQQLLGYEISIEPEPTQQTAMLDVYGNTRLFFSLQAAHTQLKVIASSLVATEPPAPVQSLLAWEQVRERFRYSAKSPYDAAAEFVFASPYVPRHADFADYARASFASGEPLMQAARNLMQRIHQDFTYQSESTEVNTPARVALAQRKGVCQDFAHIMIACLRAYGLPARYVSGYLLTQPLPGHERLVGSDASHAWVQVYLPDLTEAPGPFGSTVGGRWYDFDPTNDRDGYGSPSEDYVTLATGRDYSDVSPVRGVIHGGANHTLSVAVTVEPADAADWDGQGQAPSPGENAMQSQSQTQTQSPLQTP